MTPKCGSAISLRSFSTARLKQFDQNFSLSTSDLPVISDVTGSDEMSDNDGDDEDEGSDDDDGAPVVAVVAVAAEDDSAVVVGADVVDDNDNADGDGDGDNDDNGDDDGDDGDWASQSRHVRKVQLNSSDSSDKVENN